MKKSLILFFALSFVFFAFFCHAQINTNDVTLTINPQYPKENTNVTAVLSSYTTDLNKANISWTLNGELVIQNVGQKTFSFTTGSAGTQTILNAQIMTADGSIFSKSITIAPYNIDLLWEATDSYVPPFYQGKALSPSEGNIKIVAIPSSSSGEKYIYSWKQDDDNKPESSGYAKSFYDFKNSYLEPSNTTEVIVSSLLGNTIGDATITTTPNKSKILFYEKDPTLGTKWENSLNDGYHITSDGVTLVAEPYFFIPKELNSSDLNFKWTLGDSAIDTPTKPNQISIKPTEGQSGSSSIKLSIENIKTLFLSLNKTLNVNF